MSFRLKGDVASMHSYSYSVVRCWQRLYYGNSISRTVTDPIAHLAMFMNRWHAILFSPWHCGAGRVGMQPIKYSLYHEHQCGEVFVLQPLHSAYCVALLSRSKHVSNFTDGQSQFCGWCSCAVIHQCCGPVHSVASRSLGPSPPSPPTKSVLCARATVTDTCL